MADLSRLKRRNTLGAPPPLAEASQNLQAPEHAPVVPLRTEELQRSPALSCESVDQQEESPQPPRPRRRIDGRSLRKTGRTMQFATRVSWEWDERLRRIAKRDGLYLVEILELALDAYEKARR
jgi:hypothetical protein